MEYRIWNTGDRISNTESKKIVSFFSKPNIQHSTFNIQYSPRTRGMSLLELLLYIAILSGLMVVLANVFVSLSKGRGQSEARSEVNSAIRFASERIKQDVKNASAVSVPALGAPASTLSLTVSGSTILYDMSGGVLRRKVDAGTPEAVTGSAVSVDVPTFTRLENYNATPGILNATTTAIQSSMTFRYNSSSTDWVYSDTLRTTASFR